MDSKYKNILYIGGGAAVLYLLFKKSGDDPADTGDGNKPADELSSIFGSGLKNPGKQAMLVDTREANPIVTPAGKVLMSPAPETSAGYVPRESAKLIQAQLNWFFNSLRAQGVEGLDVPKLPLNSQIDANALKAFWLWLNILWRARLIVGDDALLGYKAPSLEALGIGIARGLFTANPKPERAVYIPTSEILGKGRPEDYTIYRLYSQSDPNLTGAFSNKLINHMKSMVGIRPTPRDMQILKNAYESYIENPVYKNAPPPYPSSWPQ